MKVQRNDQCPCGSGKKYKKCCYQDAECNSEVQRAARHASTPEDVARILAEPDHIYVFKVRLTSMRCMKMPVEISRVVELDGRQTLYDFHMAIQDAFGWDNDHCFSFYFSSKFADKDHEYANSPFGDPLGDGSHSATNYELRDLKIEQGVNYWYRFDYGDELIHTVALLEAKPNPDKLSVNKVTKSVGTPPPQYEFEDDEGEFEDSDEDAAIQDELDLDEDEDKMDAHVGKKKTTK